MDQHKRTETPTWPLGFGKNQCTWFILMQLVELQTFGLAGKSRVMQLLEPECTF